MHYQQQGLSVDLGHEASVVGRWHALQNFQYKLHLVVTSSSSSPDSNTMVSVVDAITKYECVPGVIVARGATSSSPQ